MRGAQENDLARAGAAAPSGKGVGFLSPEDLRYLHAGLGSAITRKIKNRNKLQERARRGDDDRLPSATLFTMADAQTKTIDYMLRVRTRLEAEIARQIELAR